MPSVFTQALAQPDSAYAALLAELNAKPPVPPNMFTPQQVQQRIAQNNALTELGVVGQLAGSDDVRQLGGGVFKKALADRQERVTSRGVQDPLTGETAVDPEYAREIDESRRGRVLQQALAYEGQRQKAKETEAERQRQHEYRLEEIRARGDQRAATDAELLDLKKERLRMQNAEGQARIDAAHGKVQSAADKAQLAAEGAISRAQDVSARISNILDKTGFMSTGLTGSIMGKIPGSDAYDLRREIDTIKANIGFGELQQMRQASPTGGALGQVAVQELNMLQAVLGSIDANQSEEQLRANLAQVKQHYDKWVGIMQQHAQQAAAQARSIPQPSWTGGAPAPAAQPGAPAPQPPAPTPGASGMSSIDRVRERLRAVRPGGM